MAKPSLKASEAGRELAAQSLQLLGLNKTGLASAVGCSRQPVINFFKGIAIEQGLFLKICERLNLDWRVTAGLTEPEPVEVMPKLGAWLEPDVDAISIEALVRSLRQTAKDSLYERCGTMRVLDMTRPVDLSNIYTSVHVLKQVSSHQRRKLSEILEEANASNFDRLGFGQILHPRKPVMEAVAEHKKLIILGKPGAGKTTFLKHLAIECIKGDFAPDRLPLFVNLKQFSEHPSRPSLLEFLSYRHLESQLTALSAADVETPLLQLKQVLNAGRSLILLDGLDEVSQDAQDRVLTEIRLLSEDFRDNHFLMTCRVAAWEYTFEQFTEVEIADFDNAQIDAFSRQWFEDKAIAAQSFLRSLARWPQLAELATTPLLLTLLCLAFESSGTLPGSRSELYQEGISTLLRKWDASRGIHRDQIYQKLSTKRKEELLGEIALTTFEQGQYFFHQRDLEYMIADYIRDLPEASSDSAVLQVDSSTVLHSIEAQHGLLVERAKYYYSFSHLTFHEYFSARELVLNSDNLKETMVNLVQAHATEPRWRELFLLTSELLRNADLLLSPLADKAISLLSDQPRLQAFLADVEARSHLPEFERFEPVAVRAFLFDIDFEIDENRRVALHLDQQMNYLVCASFLTRILEDMSLVGAIALAYQYDQQATDEQPKISESQSANDTMIIAIQIALDSRQIGSTEEKRLQGIIEHFYPEEAKEEEIKKVADTARSVAKKRYHIGEKHSFSVGDRRRLAQYYQVVSLIVDCLRSEGCTISPERRQSIKDSLFVEDSLFAKDSLFVSAK